MLDEQTKPTERPARDQSPRRLSPSNLRKQDAVVQSMDHGEWTRLPEIIETSGYSRPVVVRVLGDLVERGAVEKRDGRQPPGKRGRRPHEFRLNAEVNAEGVSC